MCNAFCILFGAMNLTKEEVERKDVLEVGAYNVNGSLRPLIESWGPSKYVGVDIVQGIGVDEICSTDEIVNKFGKESFDIIISTEMLEHVKDWKKAISNFKNVCKKKGTILITTRTKGAEYHAWPYDFWRYEIEDMTKIFSDFIIEKLEYDKFSPGIFLKAKKPVDFIENDLSSIELYSIITESRVKDIDEKIIRSFNKKNSMRLMLRKHFLWVMSFISKMAKSLLNIK
jgi:SAM-dependent methyltransferase